MSVCLGWTGRLFYIFSRPLLLFCSVAVTLLLGISLWLYWLLQQLLLLMMTIMVMMMMRDLFHMTADLNKFNCVVVRDIVRVNGEAQIPLRRLSAKLSRRESCGHKPWKSWTQTVTNHETIKFRWKSSTQITKVADTNHLDMSRCLRQSPWQVREKPVCVAVMEFSLLRCTGKVGNKVGDKVRGLCRRRKSWKLATWFVSRTFMICDRDTFVTLSGTCPGLFRKIGVMEFGLETARGLSHV